MCQCYVGRRNQTGDCQKEFAVDLHDSTFFATLIIQRLNYINPVEISSQIFPITTNQIENQQGGAGAARRVLKFGMTRSGHLIRELADCFSLKAV